MIMKSLALVSFMISIPALAQGPSEADDIRCTRDSLDQTQALGRIDWAVDVQKMTKRRTTNGTLRNEKYGDKAELINYWADQDEPTLGGRPIYPTHMIPIGTSGWDLINSTWRAYPLAALSETVPANYIHAAYCTSSCFYPGMKILLDNGYSEIKFAHDLKQAGIDKRVKNLIVLDSSSTLEKLKFTATPIGAFSTEITEEKIMIFSLLMQDKTVLRVTGNHIFISGKGRAETAEELAKALKAGERPTLLNIKGQAIPIGKVETAEKLTKVYNIRPQSKELLNNILVVDGYLTGSSYLQNIELEEANAHLFAHSMAHRPVVETFLKQVRTGD